MGTEKVKCSIVSGAPLSDAKFLKAHIDSASFIIAVDSGYKHCISAGINPDVILGDFDSSAIPEGEASEVIRLNPVKDDTDTFYAIKYAVEKGFNELEIFCATGSRFDHTYSNMLSLLYCYQNGIKAQIIDKHNKMMFVDKKTVIDSSEYKYFSLFAIDGAVEELTVKNAFYELFGVRLLPYEQYTQSNTFKGKNVEISFKSGNLLLIQSND